MPGKLILAFQVRLRTIGERVDDWRKAADPHPGRVHLEWLIFDARGRVIETHDKARVTAESSREREHPSMILGALPWKRREKTARWRMAF